MGVPTSVQINIPTIFDTLIALVVVYVALALFCSHMNEWIAAMANKRGAKLYLGVLNLVSGQKAIAEAIFGHPLITAAGRDIDGRPVDTKANRPAFVDSRNFSLAFWDTILRAQQAKSSAEQDPENQANALVVQDTRSAIEAPAVMIAAIAKQVGDLPASALQRQLVALLNDAQGDYDRLLRSTDAWFDRQMDRVSGWYKRDAQRVLTIIATIVVLGLGLDTVRIASRLYSDSATRNVLIQAAQTAMSPTPVPSPTAMPVAARSVAAPTRQAITGGPSATPSPAPSPSPVATTAAAGAAQVADNVQQSFASIPLDTYAPGIAGLGWVPVTSTATLWTDMLIVVGLLATIAAASAGAPFWFDLLGTLLNVRMAGPKPQSRANPRDNPPAPAP